MNYKIGLLSAALLLAPASQLVAQDYADEIGTQLVAWEQARAHEESLARHAVSALLARALNHNHKCCGDFDLLGRFEWTEIKSFINEALNLEALVTFNVNDINLLNSDKFLEVLSVVWNNLHAHRTLGVTTEAAAERYVREQVLAGLVYLLHQSGVENFLPDTITGNEYYNSTVNELGRYGLDKAVARFKGPLLAEAGKVVHHGK